jgi:hypothetical protein
MALITDPDQLSQGTTTTVSDFVITTPGSGADSRFTSAGNNLPALASGEDFEVRDHSDPLANGLWRVVTVNTSTTSYEVDKLSNGAVPSTAGSEAATTLGATGTSTEKSVYFDTLVEEIWLLEQGNLSTDGVTMLALHSFIKEEWKDDQLLIDSGAFPMVGISFAAGQWEFGEDPSGNNSDWLLKVDTPSTTDSRRLIRNAGWDQKDNTGVIIEKWFNVTTLGSFEDTADQAYYFFGDDFTTDNTQNYAFTGPVNEPVQYYNLTGTLSGETPAFASTSTITRTAGSFITDGYVVGGQVEVTNSTSNDGTYTISAVAALTLTLDGTPLTVEAWGTTTIAYDNSNLFTTSLRIRDADPNGKTFQTSVLNDAGETAISSKVIKFPLANATDLDISETDANVSTTTPYTEVRIRYLPTTYNRPVDTATARDFGVVVDVGTYSQSNGGAATTSRYDSASLNLGAGEALADYAGGTLTIHEGTNIGTYNVSGTPVDSGGTLQITLTAASLSITGSNESFTLDRATPLTATKNEIYEKIQYQLRQATDIDETGGTVIGKVAGPLAQFVGPDITFGLGSTNPNGGGSGVIVEGFDANDTNNMFFVDNGGTSRNFPFVAAGTLNFNTNLTADSAPEYWLYYEYTAQTTATDGAVVGPSGAAYDLESPGSNLPALLVNDYIRVAGFANAQNNGLFRVTAVNVSTSDYSVIRVDGEAVGAAESAVTITVDENPYNSPDAIIVDNNAGADITGAASSASIAFDYDYDNNTQGGRTSGTNAACVLKAIGLELGQYVQVSGLTITRSTGLVFTATAALERNYSNP